MSPGSNQPGQSLHDEFKAESRVTRKPFKLNGFTRPNVGSVSVK
ncbi:hypothetical protein SAMN02745166_02183 [Prosthecobacter debontii]|uniref:Uncharacterized protein n=1 Tax=Prosthecobacter debontii TaxID=48467 RepID=A0A1T4XYC6_9BACT|nr:hypothetical protein SAMN02745166_02183 [Prosthecobacter debontii]